jgi:hypothetical protein
MHRGVAQAISSTGRFHNTRDGGSFSVEPLACAGRVFAQGIGTHIPPGLIILLACKYRWFTVVVGANSSRSAKGASFEVWLDGKKAAQVLDLHDGDAAPYQSITVAGAKVLPPMPLVGSGTTI